MSLKDLFADDGPATAKLVPKRKQKAENPDRSLEGWASVILKTHTPAQMGVPPVASRETVDGVRGVLAQPEDTADKMLAYDRMLFEGLFLRYGKAWVNAQMALLLKRFPSYRRD